MMYKPELDLTLVQGETLVLPVTYQEADGTVINLSGCTARMMFRKNLEDTDTVMSIPANAGTSITVSGSIGQVLIQATKAVMTGLPLTKGVYDLFIDFPNGTSERILYGAFSVVRPSTR